MIYLEGDWHRSVIKGLMQASTSHVYVEIGVRYCETISEVVRYCDEAHGVDIDGSRAGLMPHGARFWHMTSDNFFETYNGSEADVIFIDADHSERQVKKDFLGALDILSDKGVIVLHDTWPFADSGGARHTGCGGAYEVAEAIRTQPGDLYRSMTIPRFPGLTLVTVNGN